MKRIKKGTPYSVKCFVADGIPKRRVYAIVKNRASETEPGGGK